MVKQNNKIQVGDKIWYILINQRYSKDVVELKESTVSKVGNKYFEIADIYDSRFFVSDLKHDNGNYTSKIKVYLSDADYYNDLECQKIYDKIKPLFSSNNYNNLTLEQLNKIKEILGL